MRTLHLDTLKEGLPGISAAYGAFLAEAAAVCLTEMGHQPGVRLAVSGDFTETFLVEWTQVVGDDEIASWGDSRKLVEFGAIAFSILSIPYLTGYVGFEQIEQGEGFDYKLRPNPHSAYLLPEAALEISGIMNESPGNTLSMRVAAKKKQAEKRVGRNMPVFAVVVEFSVPKAKILKR